MAASSPRPKPDNWAHVTNYVPRRPWLHGAARTNLAGGGTNLKPDPGGQVMPALTPLEAAKVELMKLGVPMPQDWMQHLSPVSALLVLQNVCEAAVTVMSGAFADPSNELDPDSPVAAEVLNGVTAGLAGSVHALVALEVLPKEAEEALSVASEVTGPVSGPGGNGASPDA